MGSPLDENPVARAGRVEGILEILEVTRNRDVRGKRRGHEGKNGEAHANKAG